MCLFFAAFATQWCYPDSTMLRASAGAVMLIIALLVALCIWITRDRYTFWWFQPDPDQVEHEEIEEDKETASCLSVSRGQTLHEFTTSLRLPMF